LVLLPRLEHVGRKFLVAESVSQSFAEIFV